MRVVIGWGRGRGCDGACGSGPGAGGKEDWPSLLFTPDAAPRHGSPPFPPLSQPLPPPPRMQVIMTLCRGRPLPPPFPLTNTAVCILRAGGSGPVIFSCSQLSLQGRAATQAGRHAGARARTQHCASLVLMLCGNMFGMVRCRRKHVQAARGATGQWREEDGRPAAMPGYSCATPATSPRPHCRACPPSPSPCPLRSWAPPPRPSQPPTLQLEPCTRPAPPPARGCVCPQPHSQ